MSKTHTPVVTIETAVAPVAEIVTATPSKLETLQIAYDAAFEKLLTVPRGTKESNAAAIETYKALNAIDAEKLSILKADKEAETVKLRNERVAHVDKMIELYVANVNIHDDARSTVEEKNAAYNAYKEAKEWIENELLAKYPTSTPSKVATLGLSDGGVRGAKGSEILEMFLTNKASGMNDTENKKSIVASGHAVGTVGAIVLAWEKREGIK